MTVHLTSEEIISQTALKLGTIRENVLRIAARSIVIRELARRHGEDFVLKGGALLFHVYGSPRASFLDTDFAAPSGNDYTVPDVEQAISVSIDGFSLDAKEGTWSGDKEMLTGTSIPFSIDGFQEKNRENQLSVSFSLRNAEVIGEAKPRSYDALDYLAEDNVFDVHGLSIEELAAEKVLATVFKGDLLPKHPFDLAVVARDHHPYKFDDDEFLRILAEKFRLERDSVLRHTYEDLGLKRPSDLRGVFLPENVRREIRKQWDSEFDRSIILTIEEQSRADHLSNVETVFSHIDGTWLPLLGRLP